MLCDKCKKNQATIKYSQNLNGEKVQYNLCQHCFNDMKYKNSMFDNFFNNFFYSPTFLNNYENNKNVCSVCGNTLERFKNTGKMGCANCYDIFRERLNPIFNDIQQKNFHIGKSPKNIETYKPDTDGVEVLKEKLENAIKNEDYEQAIKLRDKIKEIERGDM